MSDLKLPIPHTLMQKDAISNHYFDSNPTINYQKSSSLTTTSNLPNYNPDQLNDKITQLNQRRDSLLLE